MLYFSIINVCGHRTAFIRRSWHKAPSCRPFSVTVQAQQDSLEVDTKNRPFSLPPGQFRPKQSLGQNYLSDQNYVMKIVNAFSDDSVDGSRVVEIGPGMGALTRELLRIYPNMTAIELDQRAVAFLKTKLPGLDVVRQDVLETDWSAMAADRGGKLSVIANLPYYITSQVLFSLADNHHAIDKAVVTMQLEVAERVTAAPRTKQYGIPSVVFQLYGATQLNFKIPPKVFYPVPKVDSALVTIDFSKPHPELHSVEGEHLRRVITTAFRQRRKMMRQSLKELLRADELSLPDRWGTLRPEQLRPEEFLQLTVDLYGECGSSSSDRNLCANRPCPPSVDSKSAGSSSKNSNQVYVDGSIKVRQGSGSDSISSSRSESDKGSTHRDGLAYKRPLTALQQSPPSTLGRIRLARNAAQPAQTRPSQTNPHDLPAAAAEVGPETVAAGGVQVGAKLPFEARGVWRKKIVNRSTKRRRGDRSQ